MTTELKLCLPALAVLIALMHPATADAQYFQSPAQPVYQHSVSPGYAVQTYAAQGHVYYTVVYDHTGQAYYVPAQQTAVAPVHRHATRHHSHQSMFAPAMQDARHNAAAVADLVLTLHPGAWLAEKIGLMNRDRVVDRIRGHRHHGHY